MSGTGYGSEPFQRACEVAAACRAIESGGARAWWGRMRGGAPALASYRRSLPVVDVPLTGSPAGRMIGEHFAIREHRRHRYRDAQAVLSLPADSATYMRGRHRQAVRTNVGHARKAGLTIIRTTIDDWKPGEDDSRDGRITPGPVEWWMVAGPGGEGPPRAEAILSVDDHVALLHGLTSSATHARWLLHTAMVERLCGTCDLLLVNSEPAYLLPPGAQHFQRLLGYDVARLRLRRAPSARTIALPAPADPLGEPPIPA
jgi:hypothetical protein